MIRKILLYPLLLVACPPNQQEFWRNVFEDLAYGFPVGQTYIINNHLCCNKPGHSFSFKLDQPLSASEFYESLFPLLNNAEILSENDLNTIKINEYLDSYVPQNWVSIRKKNVKDVMIEKYIISMKKEYGLTIKQAKFALSFVFIAILFKTISFVKNISFEDDKIVSIDGLQFRSGVEKVNVSKKIYLANSVILQQVMDSKSLSSLWGKYLGNLKKLM